MQALTKGFTKGLTRPLVRMLAGNGGDTSPSLLPETTDYAARVLAVSGTKLAMGTLRDIDAFIGGMNDLGLWDVLQECWPLKHNAATGSIAVGLKGSDAVLNSGPSWSSDGVLIANNNSWLASTLHIPATDYTWFCFARPADAVLYKISLWSMGINRNGRQFSIEWYGHNNNGPKICAGKWSGIVNSIYSQTPANIISRMVSGDWYGVAVSNMDGDYTIGYYVDQIYAIQRNDRDASLEKEWNDPVGSGVLGMGCYSGSAGALAGAAVIGLFGGFLRALTTDEWNAVSVLYKTTLGRNLSFI